MKSPRLFLLSAATGAALVAGSMLVGPAAPAFAITCADATAAANTASANVQSAQEKLDAANAKLAEDQADDAAADVIAADQSSITNATAVHDAAVKAFNDAEAARVAACTTVTTTTTPPPSGGGTTPVARDDNYTTAVNTNLVIGGPGILGNDSDADGNPLAASLVNGAQHGAVNIAGNGAFTYLPPTNYTGPDQFVYKACDPAGNCDPATVFITVGGTPPTTTPPPVGLPVYPTCAAAFAAGVHDIPRGDPRYRTFLDADHDGIACEINGQDGVRPPRPIIINPPAPGNTTVINPPPAAPAPSQTTTIVVPPAPSGSGFSQIGQAPAGAAATGFGPNA